MVKLTDTKVYHMIFVVENPERLTTKQDKTLFNEHLIGVRYCSRYSAYGASFTLHKTPMRYLCSCFLICKRLLSKKLHDFNKNHTDLVTEIRFKPSLHVKSMFLWNQEISDI